MKQTTGKKLRQSCAWLAVLCAAGVFVSCADDVAASDTAAVTEASVETEKEAGNGRSDIADTLPDNLDFGGITVTVKARGGDNDVKMEFYSEGEDGEVVNDAVFARNSAVEERLNLTMQLELTENTRHVGFSNDIRKSVMADSDDFDLAASAMYDLVPISLEGMLTDLNALSYLDFSQPWWNQAFQKLTEYNGHNYLAMGELSQTMISGAFCMFFNKDMFREFYADEPSLYDTVKAGEWTLDKMIAYCTPLYADLNGNGQADEGDRYGHYFTDTKTLSSDSFLGGCKINLIEKQADGTYVYNGTSERAVTFFEKMETLLFENNNTCRLPYNNETIMKTMIDEQTMFTTWMLTGVNYLRDMEKDYGIIPMPKLDERQDQYTAFCHDGSSAFCIPVTQDTPDTVAAFLEAMSAETYRVVTPAYFETALKGKYSRDNETSQMLDLIVSGIYLDIAYIYGQNLNTPIDAIRGILGSSSTCSKALSTMASKEKSILKNMESIIKKYEQIES
ncbi:MAG: hypothetical protein ACI3XM_06560 [Eubacteriales bacterium]